MRGGNSLYGDSRYVGGFGGTIRGDVIGGDDEITVGNGGSNTLYGDSHAVVSDFGSITGGDDELTAGDDGSNVFYGDSRYADAYVDVIGGNDELTAGDGADFLYADSYVADAGGKVIDGDDVLMGGGGGDSLWGDTQNVNSGEHFAGEDTFVFKAGEGGMNYIGLVDFSIGGVNDEILLVGIDDDDVSIGTTNGTGPGTAASIVIAGGAAGSGQTIIVVGQAGLTIDDIDFA